MKRIVWKTSGVLQVGGGPEMQTYVGAADEVMDVPDDIAALLIGGQRAELVPEEAPEPEKKRRKSA